MAIKWSRPVSRVLSWTVIPLDAASPRRSSNLPGSDAGRAMLPYSVLLRVGFTVPCDVVLARGALLPHRFTLTTRPATPVLPALGRKDSAIVCCAPNDQARQSIRSRQTAALLEKRDLDVVRYAPNVNTANRYDSSTGVTGPFGGLFSVALAVSSRCPGVTWHPALWSPDFPRNACASRDCLADSAVSLAGRGLRAVNGECEG